MPISRNWLKAGLALVLAAAPIAGAHAEDTIKVAFDDPLSGGVGNAGSQGYRHFLYVAGKINAAGGVLGKKIEVVPFDNGADPQQAVVQAQKALDQGIRIIVQGVSASAVGAALSSFVTKYNNRHPGQDAIYLDYAATETSLTNAKCTYWHFRFANNSDMKTRAMINYIVTQKNVKKVYLLNQQYSGGVEVQGLARKLLAEKRPDIQIVGDELHPLLKITDFSPYITKIKASGADSVITNDFGQDITLLLKAASDAGLKVDWYTFYAYNPGTPTAIAHGGMPNHVFIVADGFPNVPYPPAMQAQKEFRATYGFSIWYPQAINTMNMLVKAINEAKSADPKAFAPHLENMKFRTFYGTQGFMRPTDHQFFQDVYVATLAPVTPDASIDEEKTGWGWHFVSDVPAKDISSPTTCKMNRPG